MNDGPNYLVSAGQDREPLAAWRIFTGNSTQMLLARVGIQWPAGWCMLRVNNPPQTEAGDIDVIVGRLLSEPSILAMTEEERQLASMRFSADGYRTFKPEGPEVVFDLSHLIGMELKCAYVSINEERQRTELKSKKDSEAKERRLRIQLNGLLELGFDRVYLLDVVAGIAIDAKTFGETISLSAVSTTTADKHHPRGHEPFASDLSIGCMQVTLSPNKGHTEELGGSFLFSSQRKAPPNPYLQNPDVLERRGHLVNHLTGLLSKAKISPQIPVVLDYCARCKGLGDYHGGKCPG